MFRVLLALSCGLLAGCGNPNVGELSKPPEIPEIATWDAMQELAYAKGGMSSIQRSDDPEEIKTIVLLPRFTELVTSFEQSTIPKKYLTPEREAGKVEMGKRAHELIALAKSNASGDQILAAVKSLRDAYIKVHVIDLPPK